MTALSAAMEQALRNAYRSTWKRPSWVCPPGTRPATIRALKRRWLCRGDGELTDAGERERERLLAAPIS